MASAGVADSFIKAADVKRTRYARSVIAATLYILQRRCYLHYFDLLKSDEPVSFSQWVLDSCNISTQFHNWNTVLLLELTMLTFVRSIRSLYIEAL